MVRLLIFYMFRFLLVTWTFVWEELPRYPMNHSATAADSNSFRSVVSNNSGGRGTPLALQLDYSI